MAGKCLECKKWFVGCEPRVSVSKGIVHERCLKDSPAAGVKVEKSTPTSPLVLPPVPPATGALTDNSGSTAPTIDSVTSPSVAELRRSHPADRIHTGSMYRDGMTCCGSENASPPGCKFSCCGASAGYGEHAATCHWTAPAPAPTPSPTSPSTVYYHPGPYYLASSTRKWCASSRAFVDVQISSWHCCSNGDRSGQGCKHGIPRHHPGPIGQAGGSYRGYYIGYQCCQDEDQRSDGCKAGPHPNPFLESC